MTNHHAPGLKQRRRGGRVDLYWCADPAAIKQGYTPKTVRLFGAPDSPEVAAHCRRLWAEMREWESGFRPAAHQRQPPGTIAALCEAFEGDPDSPFRACRPSTRAFYLAHLAILRQTVGERRVATVTGRDVRRWHRNWGRWNEAEQRLANPRRAYGCIQMLRRIVSYGCETRDRACLELAQMLREMEFKQPRGRTQRPTYEQILALRQKAREMGRPSIARAVALQFDLSLRQSDVIGEWIEEPARRGEPGIRDGSSRWASGLTWSHIGSDWILRKPTSKSNFQQIAEHDLKVFPRDCLAELADVPAEQRVGPVILNEHTGLPYRRRRFVEVFRTIARAAGWPDDLWNRDSRAGGVSEAFEAGAAATDAMRAATHTQLSTTMGYNRDTLEQSSRVHQLRVARRNATGTDHRNTERNTD